MCGEKCCSKLRTVLRAGSPPRVRGKGRTACRPSTASRITPACAGKRCVYRFGRYCGRDHPRVCGEKQGVNIIIPHCWGSPPRVRGKDFGGAAQPNQNGITPACAGKSQPHYRFRQCPRDHPRVCGEKTSARILLITSAGSPPRVRGKAYLRGNGNLQNRITPACAGKSVTDGITFFRSEDHPRVCGEKGGGGGGDDNTIGSPPRVRGKVCLS